MKLPRTHQSSGEDAFLYAGGPQNVPHFRTSSIFICLARGEVCPAFLEFLAFFLLLLGSLALGRSSGKRYPCFFGSCPCCLPKKAKEKKIRVSETPVCS